MPLTKFEKELCKAKARLARTQHELAKLEQAAAKRLKARRWLPDAYPDWEQSKQANTILNVDGFVRQRDQLQFEQVSTAIQASTIAKVFDLLSEVFDCDKSEICLLEDRVLTRKGKKTPVVYFRYTYNQAFNDALKAAGHAVFDPRLKAWNMPLDDDAKGAVAQCIGSFYRVVIDLSRMVILQNESVPNFAAQTRVAFRKLPFHVQIKRSEVIAAILSSRPTDSIRDNQIYVNDGSGFVAYPEQEVIWTQSPFLLFRYAVIEGSPRYVSFSTLGMVVEQVSFGNDDKKTSMAIARFMDTFHVLKMPAFELECSNIITEAHNLRSQLQGGFERFTESIGKIQSVISDIGFAPLCSDYVTLMSQNHGADSESADIIAYVVPNPDKDSYLNKIAAFFGYAEVGYPIVFTRSMLDKWNEQEDYHFLFVAAHELAHWLVLETDGEFPNEDVHGMVWAVCQDLLEYLFIGEYSITAYSQYHPDDYGTITDLEHVVAHVGIPALESIRSFRPLSKNDIKNVVNDCMAELVSCFDALAGDQNHIGCEDG